MTTMTSMLYFPRDTFDYTMGYAVIALIMVSSFFIILSTTLSLFNKLMYNNKKVQTYERCKRKSPNGTKKYSETTKLKNDVVTERTLRSDNRDSVRELEELSKMMKSENENSFGNVITLKRKREYNLAEEAFRLNELKRSKRRQAFERNNRRENLNLIREMCNNNKPSEISINYWLDLDVITNESDNESEKEMSARDKRAEERNRRREEEELRKQEAAEDMVVFFEQCANLSDRDKRAEERNRRKEELEAIEILCDMEEIATELSLEVEEEMSARDKRAEERNKRKEELRTAELLCEIGEDKLGKFVENIITNMTKKRNSQK